MSTEFLYSETLQNYCKVVKYSVDIKKMHSHLYLQEEHADIRLTDVRTWLSHILTKMIAVNGGYNKRGPMSIITRQCKDWQS
jgi:hypothetical protein